MCVTGIIVSVSSLSHQHFRLCCINLILYVVIEVFFTYEDGGLEMLMRKIFPQILKAVNTNSLVVHRLNTYFIPFTNLGIVDV